MYNRRGFSLVEAMVAVGLLAGIFLISTKVSTIFKKQLDNTEQSADVVLDQAGTMKAINHDLMNSGPAFNFVRHLPGSSQQIDFWTLTEKDDGERSILLENANQCVKFISIDHGKYLTGTVIQRKKTLVLSPSFFYDLRQSQSTPLNYASAKIKNLLVANKLDSPKQILKLSGMVPVFDPLGYYRDYGVLLKVNDSGEPVIMSSEVDLFPNPVVNDCPNANSSIDSFLRCLPSTGGGATVLFLAPINNISYCLKKNANDIGFQLIKKNNTTTILMASRVDSLKLVRKSSAHSLINLDLVFCNSYNNNNKKCR